MNILEEIFAYKRLEVAAAKEAVPASEIQTQVADLPAVPNFAAALRNPDLPAPRLIAEVKHRSPSKGILADPFEPLELARTYATNGAAAISVLTDKKYFGGSLDYLLQIAELDLGVPLLRKDFIFDEYQLLEARVAGASAALLIVGMLSKEELTTLINAANELSLTALVEVHDEKELELALTSNAKVLGINNRDLRDFSVSLETTERLRPLIPAGITVVAESGIKSQEDIARLAEAGVQAMLVGEALVTADDVSQKVRGLTRVAVP
ncbi:MAG: indole-3-glycerol phosphate synthase TrpC [Chloroflexi bacterium]|nr:MAG: indole-3-glycerol phosphate synthase TrpC [Chloroflexota bacterium]MBL1192722.1 indole-3-glycerol phosphate synthase TrpC [Chloroflexota bacterium]NOH10014.1 indole-3-glycerol phosphate synthase TrpC [Chloroflexota bacterium]